MVKQVLRNITGWLRFHGLFIAYSYDYASEYTCSTVVNDESWFDLTVK